jgi:hypothetical protein
MHFRRARCSRCLSNKRPAAALGVFSPSALVQQYASIAEIFFLLSSNLLPPRQVFPPHLQQTPSAAA